VLGGWPDCSKHHFQGELHLPWRERIGGLQGVSGNLVMSGVVVDSKLSADFHKVRHVALQTILGDQHALVIAIQQG
jgi:hypothetical protein